MFLNRQENTHDRDAWIIVNEHFANLLNWKLYRNSLSFLSS